MSEQVKQDVEQKEVEKEAEETAGKDVAEEKETPTTDEPKVKAKNVSKKEKYKEHVEKLEAKIKEQHNEYLKVYAEMENTKRRLKEESIKERKYAAQKLVGDLINPIDMLAKIVSSEAPSPEIANYLIGFKMITTQIFDILKSEGLSEVQAMNKPFDPNTMQAVSLSENPELDDDIVVNVVQNGYTFKDRILRPAMVVVNKKTVNNKEEKEEE